MQVILSLRFRIDNEERLRAAYGRLLELEPDLGPPAGSASVGEMVEAVVLDADTLALAGVLCGGWLGLGLERLQSAGPREERGD